MPFTQFDRSLYLNSQKWQHDSMISSPAHIVIKYFNVWHLKLCKKISWISPSLPIFMTGAFCVIVFHLNLVFKKNYKSCRSFHLNVWKIQCQWWLCRLIVVKIETRYALCYYYCFKHTNTSFLIKNQTCSSRKSIKPWININSKIKKNFTILLVR